MLEALTRNWWVLLVRGLCAIAFGVAAFAWPGMTLLILVMLYAAHALVDGVTAIVLAFTGRAKGEAWWGMIFVGIIGIGAGIGSFVWPGITLAVFLVFVAVWSIMRGIFEIVAAIRMRKEIDNEWILGLCGVTSILFGIALLAWPAAGLLTIVWFIGAAVIAFGVLNVILSLRLRGLHHRTHRAPPAGTLPA